MAKNIPTNFVWRNSYQWIKSYEQMSHYDSPRVIESPGLIKGCVLHLSIGTHYQNFSSIGSVQKPSKRQSSEKKERKCVTCPHRPPQTAVKIVQLSEVKYDVREHFSHFNKYNCSIEPQDRGLLLLVDNPESSCLDSRYEFDLLYSSSTLCLSRDDSLKSKSVQKIESY